MPSIKIQNLDLSVDLLTAEALPGSGIAKYFKGEIAGFIAESDFAAALNKPVLTLPAKSLSLSLSSAKDAHFGTSGADWNLGGGAKVTVSATQAGQSIAADMVYGNPAKVAAGRTFVAFAFSPNLSAAISTAAGDLQFGFSAGGSVEFRAGRLYDVSPLEPTLEKAVRDLLTTSVVPGDLADLQHMRPGDITSVAGSGQFKISAKFNVVQALNPLATPVLGLEAVGALKLGAGASLNVGASAGISGRYQIRVEKLDAARVRLGLYKMAGTQFQFDVKASAGVSASLGKLELTEKLMGLLGAAKADVPELTEAGLSESQIADIKKAIEASLSRTIALSLNGSFAASSERTTVFEYEFDLNRLDAAGSDALHRALEADFEPLTLCDPHALPAGVIMLSSELDTVLEKSITWRVNLLGILNFLHVTRLVKSGKVLFDVETGELVVTDSATAKNIALSTNSLAADAHKLRRVLMQSAVLTAAYRATGAEKSLALSGCISYFEQVTNGNRQNVSDFLDNLVALNLLTDPEKQEFVGRFHAGRASVFVEAAFARRAFDVMFTDKNGEPLPAGHYDGIGRMCVAELIRPEDPNHFRRIPMLDDELWNKMTKAGQARIHELFDAPLNSGIPLWWLIHDYEIIVWWSKAMSAAAKKVVAMKNFLSVSGLDAESLKDNKEFIAKRRDLHDALASVVKQAEPEFLDAWGLLAMYAAGQRLADVRGMVLTPGPVCSRARTVELVATA